MGERTTRLAVLGRGSWMGGAAGGVWAAAEHVIARVAGSVAPAEVWMTIAGADVAIGVLAGAIVALLAPTRAGGAQIGLAVVLGLGFARVVAPPGVAGEVAYLVAIPAAWVAGRWVLGGPDGGLATAGRVAWLGVLAIVGGGVVLDALHAPPLRGWMLLGAVLVAPLGLIALDRALGAAIRSTSRRVALHLALVVAAAALWGRPLNVAPRLEDLVTSVPPPPGTPDVILVTLDTTRADHLSTYGYERETSPNLSRLARDGILYRVARSPAGWTLPGHASIMTGLYPSGHGATLTGGWTGGETIDGRRNVAMPLASSYVTLAEILRDRGYRTGAFVSNFSYLYRDYGIAQGFGIYDDAPGIVWRVEVPALKVIGLVRPAFGLKPFRPAREIVAAGLRWLDAGGRERPSFLFVNFMEPHQPWLAEPPWDRWGRDLPGAWRLARMNLYTHAVRDISAETAAFIRAQYDGQVAAMDAALGELVEALKARGRYENALIVVTADHGELLGEHSEMGHMGRTLYEPLLRVPLIVKLPGGAQAGRVVDYPVQLVDLLPTIATIAGATVPEGIDGTGLGEAERIVFAEEGINPFLVSDYGEFYNRAMRVVYDGEFKLLSTSRGERRVFDLARDPGEEHDLAAVEPERLARLEALLARRAARAVAAASETAIAKGGAAWGVQ